jgi:hypothetical protein
MGVRIPSAPQDRCARLPPIGSAWRRVTEDVTMPVTVAPMPFRRLAAVLCREQESDGGHERAERRKSFSGRGAIGNTDCCCRN